MRCLVPAFLEDVNYTVPSYLDLTILILYTDMKYTPYRAYTPDALNVLNVGCSTR